MAPGKYWYRGKWVSQIPEAAKRALAFRKAQEIRAAIPEGPPLSIEEARRKLEEELKKPYSEEEYPVAVHEDPIMSRRWPGSTFQDFLGAEDDPLAWKEKIHKTLALSQKVFLELDEINRQTQIIQSILASEPDDVERVMAGKAAQEAANRLEALRLRWPELMRARGRFFEQVRSLDELIRDQIYRISAAGMKTGEESKLISLKASYLKSLEAARRAGDTTAEETAQRMIDTVSERLVEAKTGIGPDDWGFKIGLPPLPMPAYMKLHRRFSRNARKAMESLTAALVKTQIVERLKSFPIKAKWTKLATELIQESIHHVKKFDEDAAWLADRKFIHNQKVFQVRQDTVRTINRLWKELAEIKAGAGLHGAGDIPEFLEPVAAEVAAWIEERTNIPTWVHTTRLPLPEKFRKWLGCQVGGAHTFDKEDIVTVIDPARQPKGYKGDYYTVLVRRTSCCGEPMAIYTTVHPLTGEAIPPQ